MKIEHAVLATSLALAMAGCSKAPSPEPVPPVLASAATVASPAPAPTAENPGEALAWLAGDWCGMDDTQEIQESWLPPRKGEAIGMSRTVAGGRMISFEFMRIADLEGKVTLIAQPSGDPAVNFLRTDGGGDWIRFENKQHDYPQRIEYRKDGEGLLAEIGGPGEGDKEEVLSYRYQRCGK
ncbi:MAG: DUF6265 family protein [Arenimonas sp.]